ncbi:transcription factor IIIA isoform X1 [Diospyros lotus]|uniref:transcription factor IIIA isoform X1 n=1 Tax=Diospyros lotus TaxID=55363 RepID=UPI00224F845D|nr:transcription factor IIIA isoform X1 [Diospyros lotus]
MPPKTQGGASQMCGRGCGRGMEVIFKDIRRYYCEYCGISRSKKSLLTSHLLSHHQEEMKETGNSSENFVEEERVAKSNTCEECGASFCKPAHLRQHMLSHSLDRPFTCPINDCHSSYRRKDHLTRHLLQHEGKLFECPVENCSRKFSFQGNVKRHVEEFHCKSSPPGVGTGKNQYVCQEMGCGKVFKYPSKLLKHEATHVTLDTVEVICSEPGCMKYFTNEQCLKAHVQSCHGHIICEICGTKQLKKNIKRHLRTHETGGSPERIKCNYQDCTHTFSKKSNLKQHVKAVHLAPRRFTCRIPGCDLKFSYKHVRDNHEKSGCHVYSPGDFVESDEQFRSRPRGGLKRKCPDIETLSRKRVVGPPNESNSVVNQVPEYLSWLLSAEDDDDDNQL